MQTEWTIDAGAGLGSTGTLEQHADQNTQFDYDALDPKGRRKSPPSRIVREDVHVRGGKRTRLIANARDLAKNFSIAAWMVRRHLDYCASFAFQAKTGDRGLDREVETLMAIQSQPLNCDRGGRFTREKLFRYAEAARVVEGDCGLLRLSSGQTQILSSDLIRNPADTKTEDSTTWVDGVRIDPAGMPREFALYARGQRGAGYDFQRTVAARNFIHYGFFDRCASDQVRGISPVVAALNNFRDVYDNIEFAQVKAKISQLFAIALLRKSEAQGLNEAMPTAEQTEFEAGNITEDELSRPREFDLSGGPTVFDLDEDEDIKLIESNTPANEFQAFQQVVIAIALKSLDIPFSFYSENFTNYSGSRTAWLHYERACEDRRADQIEMRRRWTLWTIQRWIAAGLFSLPSGATLGSIKFEWVPRGMPWWKPSEEIVGDIKAIAAGLDNIDRVCKQRDRGDPRDNIDANLEVMKYAKDRAVEILGEDGANFRLNWDAIFAPGSNDATV